MSLTDITVSERNQIPMSIYDTIPFTPISNRLNEIRVVEIRMVAILVGLSSLERCLRGTLRVLIIPLLFHLSLSYKNNFCAFCIYFIVKKF